MNINKMLKQGYLFNMRGRTEVLTDDVYSKCIEIQSLNTDLKDKKGMIDSKWGWKVALNDAEKLPVEKQDKYYHGKIEFYKREIDKLEKEIIILKSEIKQKKKELQSHKEFNIRIDQSVYPPQTYDLTKDEMPCRKSHGRFSNGEYYFYDFYDEEVSDE